MGMGVKGKQTAKSTNKFGHSTLLPPINFKPELSTFRRKKKSCVVQKQISCITEPALGFATVKSLTLFFLPNFSPSQKVLFATQIGAEPSLLPAGSPRLGPYLMAAQPRRLENEDDKALPGQTRLFTPKGRVSPGEECTWGGGVGRGKRKAPVAFSGSGPGGGPRGVARSPRQKHQLRLLRETQPGRGC